MTDDEEIRARRDKCTRFLGGHGPVSASALLATIPPGTNVDTYGQGGVVAELEAEVGRLLGKPAAAFLPSGTMAQQAVLRVHADARHRRTVLFHPMCHLERHEEQGYQRLHGLTGRPVGDPNRLLLTYRRCLIHWNRRLPSDRDLECRRSSTRSRRCSTCC